MRISRNLVNETLYNVWWMGRNSSRLEKESGLFAVAGVQNHSPEGARWRHPLLTSGMGSAVAWFENSRMGKQFWHDQLTGTDAEETKPFEAPLPSVSVSRHDTRYLLSRPHRLLINCLSHHWLAMTSLRTSDVTDEPLTPLWPPDATANPWRLWRACDVTDSRWRRWRARDVTASTSIAFCSRPYNFIPRNWLWWSIRQ